MFKIDKTRSKLANQLLIKISEDDYNKIKGLAKKYEMTMSEIIRQMINCCLDNFEEN